MDDPIICLSVVIVGGLAIWGFIQRFSGNYEDGSFDGEYDESSDSSRSSNSAWNSTSRRSGSGTSWPISRGSSSSSRSSSSSSSSSSSRSPVKSSRPTKTYDSSRVKSSGGFGRTKK